MDNDLHEIESRKTSEERSSENLKKTPNYKNEAQSWCWCQNLLLITEDGSVGCKAERWQPAPSSRTETSATLDINGLEGGSPRIFKSLNKVAKSIASRLP